MPMHEADRPTRVTFIADEHLGEWRVTSQSSYRGATLAPAGGLRRIEGRDFEAGAQSLWSLRGVRSNERYTSSAEKALLAARQEGLGRAGSTRAALLPIRKSSAWWQLAQDERRALFEERSRHIAIGSEYLPAIARRLYHGRDLGEPFDFLTWFEFDVEHTGAFEELLGRLRETDEWRWVDWEVDVRLTREAVRQPLG